MLSNKRIEIAGQVFNSKRRRTTLALLISSLLSVHAFAGGVDVSVDEIYTDGVTLTTYDGLLLDINGDTFVDLVVASNNGTSEDRSRYYLGNGDGTFQDPILLAIGPTSHIAAGDMDNDMIVDLVQGRRDRTIILHRGDGAGALAAGISTTADEYRVLDLAIGDLDLDGDLDIVIANGREGASALNPPQPNRYYLSDIVPGATLGFAGADIAADADVTRAIALVDLDGDGDLDVIVGNDETTPNSDRIYLNQVVETGTLSFDAGIDFGPADDQNAKILVGDLNNNGLPDIVILNHVRLPESSGMNRVFLNATVAGVFALNPIGIDIGTDEHDSSDGVLADFDGDGDLDLVVTNLLAADGTSSRNRLYLNQLVETGTFSFDAGRDISADERRSRGVAAADLNGDGHLDLIIGNQSNFLDVPGNDRRYLNNGTDDPFANVVPVIDGVVAPLETDENTALELLLEDLEVTDPDNVYPHDFTLTVEAGTNYTVDGTTITPADGFAGDLTVPVTVNDGTDESESFDLTVTVQNTINTAPTFTSTPVENAIEEVAYTYSITVEDPDAGDILTFTAPTLPAWLALADNGDGTATLSGTPAVGDAGDHAVSLVVTDGTETATQSFTIAVAEAGSPPVNSAPTFTSTPVEEATEAVAYTYDITATDSDAGDTLTITAPTLPDWLTLTDDGDGNATLSGTPATADVGEHDVALEVSDGTETATQVFTVTVAEAAAPPTFPPPSSGGGGGSEHLLSLLALGVIGAAMRRRRRLVS